MKTHVLYRCSNKQAWVLEGNFTPEWLRQWVCLTIQEVSCPFIPEISFFLTDDKTIQRYNFSYRGQNKPTNVLSFPSHQPEELRHFSVDQPPLPMGDIMLALETIKCEAVAQGISFKNHFSHLVVHGILHLWGYDHDTKEKADLMEGLEQKILGYKNIPNPYESCIVG